MTGVQTCALPIYQTQIKENSSGLGARHGLQPDRNSLPAVIVRDPRKAADLVKFQNRQYSLDERRNCVKAFAGGPVRAA